MSENIEEQTGNIMVDSLEQSQDAGSDLEDRSSSLSEIEDKEADPDEQDEQDEQDEIEALDSDNESPFEENDSEAETERLEDSPHAQRKQNDVVFTSKTESQTFTRSPSKLQTQVSTQTHENDEDDADDLSEEGSVEDGFPKSPDSEPAELDPTTVTTSLEDSSGESKRASSTVEQTSKKRKRSLIADLDAVDVPEIDEPARKRTGSIGAAADDYMNTDANSANDDADNSNPISGDVSDVDTPDPHGEDEDAAEAKEEYDGTLEDESLDTTGLSKAPLSKTEGKRIRKQHNISTNGVDGGHDNDGIDADKDSSANVPVVEEEDGEEPEDSGELEGEDAEAAIKNEEEQKKKRIAMDQLGDIEQHFASFRDRLHEERLALLDREEWMLRQDPPTHPQYLAMLQCIDARRDEKLRIEQRLVELRRESIQRSAVAKRSQIFAQYYQEAREIRESFVELAGKQWYDIQHERRGYGLNVEDYAIKFPTKRSQQLKNQYAYNTEVSILAGIAKYVGFPAAPPMSPATTAERDQDLEKMGRSQHKHNRAQQGLPFQDLAALRAATSSSSFRPAEEQFIEQTPWANPQHPSNVHILQRQTSTQQAGRTSSPLSNPTAFQAQRPPQQGETGHPISGTFSNQTLSQSTNGTATDRVSPLNPFSSSAAPKKKYLSPLGSRQSSPSPEPGREAPDIDNPLQQTSDSRQLAETDKHLSMGNSYPPDNSQRFSQDPDMVVKPEPPLVAGARY